MLYIRETKEVISSKYLPFVEYIKKFEITDFITLNHDFLLENVLTGIMNKKYSDGFTMEQKILFYDKKPLNVFMNVFQEPITLLKLHGSLDTYQYIFYNEEGSSANPTGDYLYFKTLNYYEKQTPERFNADTEEKVQTFHFNVSPQFIMGTKKENIIKSDKMYKELYTEFSNRIHKNETLLIIGYAYGDKHVNDQIILAVKAGGIKKIININPCQKFPFPGEGVEIVNLESMGKLSEVSL